MRQRPLHVDCKHRKGGGEVESRTHFIPKNMHPVMYSLLLIPTSLSLSVKECQWPHAVGARCSVKAETVGNSVVCSQDSGRRPVHAGPEDRSCGVQVRVVTREVLVPWFGVQAAFLSRDFFARGYQTSLF